MKPKRVEVVVVPVTSRLPKVGGSDKKRRWTRFL